MIDKVSVIIPTHNRPHFLARAVDSVLSQTYHNVEAVVVDDNMPNSSARKQTAEVMERFAGNPRVLYVQGDRPLGGGPARNLGIQSSRGTYITFLDDDDEYLPDKVASQLQFTLDNHLDMSFTDVYLCDGAGRLVEYRRHTYVTDWSNTELMRQHILHSLGPTSTFMARREAILSVGGFADVPMGQDFMLMWRMIEYGTRIGYFPDAQIIQYLHDGERISVGSNKINGENRLYELKQTKKQMLTPEERRYVDFRHFAVLSVTSLRGKKKWDAVRYGLHAVRISPRFFLREAHILLHNRRKARHTETVRALPAPAVRAVPEHARTETSKG